MTVSLIATVLDEADTIDRFLDGLQMPPCGWLIDKSARSI